MENFGPTVTKLEPSYTISFIVLLLTDHRLRRTFNSFSKTKFFFYSKTTENLIFDPARIALMKIAKIW